MSKTDAGAGPAALRSRRTDFKTREAEGGGRVIEGYFIVFDQPYYVDEYLEEVICRGAIDERTDASDVRALVDHLSHLVLGRSTANTLAFSVDDVGLFATIQLNEDDTDAVSLYARTQRGDVDQASFGFGWEDAEMVYIDLPDGRVRREIRHIGTLFEVSVCTFPAYEQTYVSARSKLSEDVRRHRIEAQKKRLKRRLKHHA